jgi:hypothetical protein
LEVFFFWKKGIVLATATQRLAGSFPLPPVVQKSESRFSAASGLPET